METSGGLSRPAPEIFTGGPAALHPRADAFIGMRRGKPRGNWPPFGDRRRTVRYLAFIYDKVSPDRL
ncbi:hypothetical protein BN1263530030 [Stenotrophomonas indicatrix]|nr:hypothetical protein BN1263530030 [Stenotrophomonas indicatrix]